MGKDFHTQNRRLKSRQHTPWLAHATRLEKAKTIQVHACWRVAYKTNDDFGTQIPTHMAIDQEGQLAALQLQSHSIAIPIHQHTHVHTKRENQHHNDHA
jgi:hypothetical protein